MEKDATVLVLEELLGVKTEDAHKERKKTWGAYVVLVGCEIYMPICCVWSQNNNNKTDVSLFSPISYIFLSPF